MLAPLHELEISVFANDFAMIDTTQTGTLPLTALPKLLATHLQREPSEAELAAVKSGMQQEPVTFTAWVQWVSGVQLPAEAYNAAIAKQVCNYTWLTDPQRGDRCRVTA